MEKLRKTWQPLWVVSLLGVLSAYYFGIVGTSWAVTGEFTRWGAHVMKFLGMDTSKYTYLNLIHFSGTPLDRADGVMILGMFLGAFIAALVSNNVKWRLPTSKVRVYQAIGGGILAGFGARLAMGCNLAAFFTGIPQFSLHAWLFTIFTILGTYIGTKIIKRPLFRTKIKLEKKQSSKLYEFGENTFPRKNKLLLLASGIVTLILLAVVATKQPLFPLITVFGLAFGFLLEKGQICFTSAFRDLWTVGRSNMTTAIIAGMLLSTIGTFAFIHGGMSPKIMWAGPNAALGGLIFGVGIVIAGGCETGWMYRAVEGQVHYMLVGVGNIIGSVLLVMTWDKIAPAVALAYPKVDLLKTLGDFGGLIVTYGALLLALGLVFIYEKRYFRKNDRRKTDETPV